MAARLPNPFGVGWDDLTLADLIAFLGEPRDESLTWEAKGGDIRPQHVREAVCGFANSELGGMLILGATQDRRTKAWTIDGWQPRDEVELWVGNCLGNDGVLPRPSTLVKSWALEAGGRLGVVAVWPVAVPPAITSDGQVWERTSSATTQVKDPVALRRLFERGEAAEDRIYELSNSSGDDLIAAPPGQRPVVAALGFAAASLPSEVSGLIFRRSFNEALTTAAMELGRQDVARTLQGFVRAEWDLSQAAVAAWSIGGFADDGGYSIRVGRHGSVAVGYSNLEVEHGAEWAGYSLDHLQRMWATATRILGDLGAMGTIHVAARFSGSDGRITAAATWSDMTADGDEEIHRMVRDVRRAIGRRDWEPEVDIEGGLGPALPTRGG